MKKMVLQENKTQVHLMRNTVEASGQGFFNAAQQNESAKEAGKETGIIN